MGVGELVGEGVVVMALGVATGVGVATVIFAMEGSELSANAGLLSRKLATKTSKLQLATIAQTRKKEETLTIVG